MTAVEQNRQGAYRPRAGHRLVLWLTRRNLVRNSRSRSTSTAAPSTLGNDPGLERRLSNRKKAVRCAKRGPSKITTGLKKSNTNGGLFCFEAQVAALRALKAKEKAS